MSAQPTEEELKHYTAVIDAILSTADLETVSRKKIRQGLEKALGGKDLSDQKRAIKNLIEDRFDAINSQTQSSGNMPTPPSHPATSDERTVLTKREHSQVNGYEEDEDEADCDGEIKVSVGHQPAKKKQKRPSAVVDEDARLAAELQAQEDRLAAGRATRGSGTGKNSKPKKKSAPKKKTPAKIKGDDDSDVDSSEPNGAKEKRKASGGFQKPFNLSAALAELCGEAQLSRPQVVKKMWEHIKGNDLQDPKDKRQIRCDEKMSAVFKQNRIDMFQMNKQLGAHLYPIDEEE